MSNCIVRQRKYYGCSRQQCCHWLLPVLFEAQYILSNYLNLWHGNGCYILNYYYMYVNFCMQPFLKSAGQDAMDGIKNAISRTSRRCVDFLQSIASVGITIMSLGTFNYNQIRPAHVPSGLGVQMSRVVSRVGRSSRAGLLISVVPTAIYISVHYWWTRRSKWVQHIRLCIIILLLF